MTKQKVKPKKSEKGKDASSTGSSHDSKSSSSVPMSPSDGNPMSPPHHPVRSSHRVSFVTEIQSMMYALGDCKKPLPESASLVEDLVHHQVTVLLQKAADVCLLRGARFISIEDFIFLMRKDHDKLRRLFQFLNFKDSRIKIVRQMSCEEEEAASEDQKASQAKRRRLCQDFLTAVDHTGELMALLDSEDIDAVKMERQDRADQKARGMDLTAYKEYTEARQVNFIKKASKFKEWLDIGNLEPKPNAFAVEIVGYLAYETVAQIVDLALLVRRDTLAASCDPITKSMAPIFYNTLPPLNTHPHSKLKLSTPPTTPSQSPVPSSPKSPTDKMVSPFLSSTNGNGNGSNLSGSINSNTSDSSSQSQGESKANLTPGGTPKSKSKKKKKGNGSSLLALTQYRALQPQHISEAMRRYNDIIKPMAPFSKYVTRGKRPKLLVC